MTPVEILDIWARACSGLPWLLYRESLLCAVGHGHFPQELRSARVAVFAADLPRLLDTVLPALPSDWVADFSGFTQECMPVQILCENQLLLEIDVLLHERKPKLDAVRRRHNRFLKLLRLLVGEGGFYSFVKKNTCHMTVKRLVSAMAKTGEPGEWYYDGFTEKAGDLYPAAWIEDTVTISCGEETYPAPVGYLSYLREVYGDYETGLFDDLGCGLTEADKVSLKIHQEHCKEALAFIQQLSREFGLRYYLLAGSVLGPVRHGGFIPWDDDIDIGIRLEDLEHFEALVEEYLPQRLPEGFSLKKPGVNSTFPRMFSKICYEGRCCMDLWPLIPTYRGGLRAKILWKFGKVITKVHYKKIGYKVTRFKTLVKLVDPFLSDKLVMALARGNERQFLGKPTDAYINLYSIYTRQKETILRRWLDTEATLAFDGLVVPVVGCTDEYLTHLYGDYMVKPAPWKRASRHVERF